MRKGVAISVFVLGVAMTCTGIAVLTLGAVEMGAVRSRRRVFSGFPGKKS